MKNIFLKNEPSIATGLFKPKTTALFFDKLWIPSSTEIIFDSNIPKSILYTPDFWDSYQWDRKMVSMTMLNKPVTLEEVRLNLKDINFTIDLDSPLKSDDTNKTGSKEKPKYEEMTFKTSHNRNKGIREFVTNMKSKYNVDVTPIYIDKTDFEKDFFSSSDEFISNPRPLIIAMDNIPSILEEELDWEQILDFRKDKKAKKHLRNFRTWANDSLITKSDEQIRCAYEKAFNDYESALKKHGIITSAGALSMALGISATVLSAISDETLAKIAAGLNITANLSLYLPTLYYSHIERTNSPIAYIYDILKLND